MTLLELITNCINFTTQDEEELNPSNLETFRNSSNYRAFIKNALPEINRAIQELVVLKKIPIKVLQIEMVNNFILPEDVYSIYKVEVEAKNSLYSPVEYRKIGNMIKLPIIYQAEKTYIKYHPRIRLLTEADKGTLEYGTQANEVTFEEFTYLVMAKKLVKDELYKIKDLTENQYKVATSTYGYRNATSEDGYISVDNSLDLNKEGLSDTICTAVIPYLVKANIWQEIEPELAQLSRNIGLQNASLLESVIEEPYQTSIARTNDWGE